MKRRTRFRGDLQVDGQILGPDGQPVGGDGGSSVDLAHLTELGFTSDVGDASLVLKPQNDDGYLAVVNNVGPDSTYHWSMIAAENQPDGEWGAAPYQAGLYADEGGYAGVYIHSAPEVTILESHINRAGVIDNGGQFLLWADGKMQWGDGAFDTDVTLARAGAGALFFSAGSGGAGVYLAADHGYVEAATPDATYPAFGAQIAGDAGDRFAIMGDGSLHWGDGILAPNVSLQRVDTSWWGDNSGFLQILGSGGGLDTGLFVGDITNDAPGVMVTENGVQVVGTDRNAYLNSAVVSVSAFGGGPGTGRSSLTPDRGLELVVSIADFALRSKIDGDSYDHFEILTDGMLRWGDGASFPDTYLERTAPGVLRLDGNLAFVGMSGISFATDNDASPDVTLTRRAAGVLELEENGGGLVLHSPDGTAYKISVANGGALSAVAA